MKTRPSRRNRGFTLIELLVVIAIIAVLAAASFGMVNLAMKKARQTVARQVDASLEQAINNFYTEYGRLPSTSATPPASDSTPPIDTTTADGIKLLTILLGKETGTTMENPKQMKFLDVQEAKAKKGGIEYDAGGVPTGLYDPWGNGYRIVIDYDYDEDITPPTESLAVPSTSPLHGKHVIAYSMGVDKTGLKEAVHNW